MFENLASIGWIAFRTVDAEASSGRPNICYCTEIWINVRLDFRTGNSQTKQRKLVSNKTISHLHMIGKTCILEAERDNAMLRRSPKREKATLATYPTWGQRLRWALIPSASKMDRCHAYRQRVHDRDPDPQADVQMHRLDRALMVCILRLVRYPD